MTCNLINKTGGAITDVTFQHEWNESVDQPILGSGGIADGDSVPVPIHVGDGDDYWTVKFTDSSGQCWYRDEKECAVEQEDFQSGNPVNVTLYAGSVGFSIAMPVSSSCLDNYYDQC